MIRIIFIIFLLLTSCEIFVIGDDKPKKEVIDLTQDSSIGTVYLFNEELQRDNIPGAAQLLGQTKGTRLQGEEQLRLYHDLWRISRIVDQRKVSRVLVDTLSNNLHTVKLELDYLKEFQFTTKKFDSTWYILDYEQLK